MNTEEAEKALADYRERAGKLGRMSHVQVRQLMGTQEPGDPRVEYLAGNQFYINLANTQLASLLRVVTDVLHIDPGKFMAIQAEELDKQISLLEEDLCITGWSSEGEPIFDLQAHRERTEGWPE